MIMDAAEYLQDTGGSRVELFVTNQADGGGRPSTGSYSEPQSHSCSTDFRACAVELFATNHADGEGRFFVEACSELKSHSCSFDLYLQRSRSATKVSILPSRSLLTTVGEGRKGAYGESGVR